MKVFKKLSAVVLAALLAMSMSVMAFAVDSYSIKLPATNNHKYEIYQIFTGDLTTKGEGENKEMILSNVKWGQNCPSGKTPGDAVPQATLKALSDLKGSDVENLAEITQYVVLSNPIATGNSGESISVPAGYYLIKDKNDSVSGNDAYSLYMVEVVGSVELNAKSAVPTVEKKVKDTNDTTGETTDWQDAADHDIGDSVSFQLTGTLPENYDDYEHYYYEFHDTLSAGLTYNNDAQVFIVTGDTRSNVTTQFDMTGAIGSIKCVDLKAITGATTTSASKIVVEYSATLNTNAFVGATGNPNDVTLEFSNNPNNCGDGTTKPGNTGETPKDTVIVFTYKLDVNKVELNDQGNPVPLTGAGFTLSKKVGSSFVPVSDELTGAQMTTFTWTGLDDGIYKLAETTVPAGYNKIKDIYFEVEAVHSVTDNAPALESLAITRIGTESEGNMKTAEGGKVTGVSLSDGVLGDVAFSCDTTDGAMATTIVNQSGITLPSTGGMGTTMFYVVGSAMVAAAVVLLISKKRMEH